MLDLWPCGSLLTVRLFTVYPQTVPVSFENAWLAEMWSPGVDDQTAPTMTSAGIYQGWQFETVMQDPRVVLGTGTTRAGAVGGVLQIAFVPANAASKLILTAVSPSGWDFQAVDVCESVDEAVVCVRASASANSPNVLILDDISIKAQVLFQRELRNVRLASGGGIARFELATFALGQMGNEVAADSSGSLATWRLPGALEVSALQLGTYQSIVRDTGDTIFQQLPPRLLLRETVLIIHFSVTQACFSGDILSLEDPTGTFEMFQENATIKQVGNGFMLDFPSSASAKPPNALEITVEDVMAPGTVFCLQLNARLRRQIEQTSTNEVSRKLFNFRAFRSTESLPLNTNDGLILTSLLSQESWSSSSLLLPFNMAAQVGAPGTQIQVSGDIQVVDDLWLLAPVGVVIVSPCSPTPCSDITQDFNGTGRQAALLLPTSERFGLRVELPASWDSGRNDWVAVVPAQGRLDGVKAKMWASDNSVSLRAMPASVTYPAVALTFSVDLAVSLSPGAAALALLGSASQSYIQVQAPVGYTLRCGGFRSSLPDSARVDCQVGPGPGEAVLGISNVDLNAAGTLHFSFGLDTPAADPSPNLFSIALRDASNVTLDAAMAVPGMHIPQARVEAFVSLLVVDFENVARLQAWGEAAQELGVLRGSIAAALNIGEEGVSVDYVQAVLGISDARRLQSSGVVAGQLQVNFSAYSNLVQLAELSDRIVVGGFAAGLQSELGPRAIAAGLVELQVTGASVPATPVPSQPPNVTTPTLRWSSADANSTGTVSVNLIFQRSTSAIRAVLIQLPVGYSHLLVSVDDLRIIQRGATSAFPMDQPQTRSTSSITVLLNPGATIAAGGYGFEFPFRMPTEDPIQNIWTVSLCSGVYCDNTRHASVITSFAFSGFEIGDLPTLLRPAVSASSKRKFSSLCRQTVAVACPGHVLLCER